MLNEKIYRVWLTIEEQIPERNHYEMVDSYEEWVGPAFESFEEAKAYQLKVVKRDKNNEHQDLLGEYFKAPPITPTLLES